MSDDIIRDKPRKRVRSSYTSGGVRIRQLSHYEGRVLFNKRTWLDKLLEKIGVRSEKAAWDEINRWDETKR